MGLSYGIVYMHSLEVVEDELELVSTRTLHHVDGQVALALWSRAMHLM